MFSKFYKFIPLYLGCCACLIADQTTSYQLKQEDSSVELSKTTAKSRKNGKKSCIVEEESPFRKTRKPYFIRMKTIDPKRSILFQGNVGVGFLYFSNIRGNISTVPQTGGLPFATVPLRRGFSYNRTPVFEYQIGYRIFDWLKVALSYQNQSGIFIQSAQLPFSGYLDAFNRRDLFEAYLSLNSLMGKFYLQPPKALNWNKLIFNPFLGAAIGCGWQTWLPVGNFISVDPPFSALSLNLKQQVMANATFMIDSGVNVQPSKMNSPWNLYLGTKFMYWGQARNIGQITKQGTTKLGYFKPIRIKSIYSFIPYLGFQWSFPAAQADFAKSCKIDIAKCRKFFVKMKNIQNNPTINSEFNVGPNFLYFAGVKGNIAGQPATLFDIGGRYAPVKERMEYNKAPIYEYSVGYQPYLWLNTALSVQSQTNLLIKTAWVPSLYGNITHSAHMQLQSWVNLTALMAKFTLSFPYGMRVGFISFNPFVAFGVGGSWQTWSNTTANSFAQVIINFTQAQVEVGLNNKTIANVAFMVDAGFKMKPLSGAANFNVTMGCKYNQWGQVRNIGKITQQGNLNKGLVSPFRVKTLYSFAPYLGFQWDFAVTKDAYIKDRNAHTDVPYFASLKCIEKPAFVFTQFNVGPNFLRFNKVEGNFAGKPIVAFPYVGSVPYKNSLSKNGGLLFEYLLGYQLKHWLKFATSFQMQQGLVISTTPLRSFSQLTPGYQASLTKFTSQVSLYSLMGKVFFELPQAVIYRSVATTPYAAGAIGVSWQNWSVPSILNNYNDDTGGALTNVSSDMSLRAKTIANLAYMVDLGLRLQNAAPSSQCSILLGCKYNQWGQVRNLGKINQQSDNTRIGLFKPFKVKTLYSFAPYLGFQWNF